ncbi:hypothetical protein AB0M47_39200 [Hamadaea sp. NPDC051192]|uniref:hypothetical protein n=1 Tax=Hamadaea sp. NPDC051192 TaxID=3154940 RepID=UPI003419E54D
MVEGVIVVESLLPGSKIDQIELVVTSLERIKVTDPAPGQPPVWTLVTFRSGADPDRLAQKVSVALESPGWYADFHDENSKWIVYPAGVVFRFARDDAEARSSAQSHGLGLGIPVEQLDWKD